MRSREEETTMDDMELEQKPVEEQLPPPQKKGIQIGTQERILLMLLVIVALLFCAYYFGYKN
jgi:cell division protein FtsL